MCFCSSLHLHYSWLQNEVQFLELYLTVNNTAVKKTPIYRTSSANFYKPCGIASTNLHKVRQCLFSNSNMTWGGIWGWSWLKLHLDLVRWLVRFRRMNLTWVGPSKTSQNESNFAAAAEKRNEKLVYLVDLFLKKVQSPKELKNLCLVFSRICLDLSFIIRVSFCNWSKNLVKTPGEQLA